MAKVLFLYYSMYGHVETMAQAVAEGAQGVAGTEVTLKRMPETIPAERAAQIGVKVDQQAPVATVDELADYDAISSARRRASATWPARCAPSSIRRGDGG